MRYIYSSAIIAFLSFCLFTPASASEQENQQKPTTIEEQKKALVQHSLKNEEPKEGIKIYTSYSMNWYRNFVIFDPVDISLIINGELVVAKNNTIPYQESYIIVDKKYNLKEISEGKFIWEGMLQGKKWKYSCKAYDLPRYVQEGVKGVATALDFECTVL
jgi:hypothetical protein